MLDGLGAVTKPLLPKPRITVPEILPNAAQLSTSTVKQLPGTAAKPLVPQFESVGKGLLEAPKFNLTPQVPGRVKAMTQMFEGQAKSAGQLGFSAIETYDGVRTDGNAANIHGKYINIKGVDVVELGPGTLTGSDTLLLKNGSKIKAIDGYFDVVVHGSTEGFYVRRGKIELFINHRSMANYIKTLDDYKPGMNIRLVSCNTGKDSLAVAQDLSNKLGVKVMAPDDFVHIYPNGKIVVGPDQYTYSGKWIDFVPATTSPKPNF